MQHKIINIDPETLGGTPVFYGTRVPIKNLYDSLKENGSIKQFLEDFPTVTRWQVDALLLMSQRLLISSTEILHENIA